MTMPRRDHPRILVPLTTLALLALLAFAFVGAGPAGAQSSGAPSTIPGGGSPTVVKDTPSSTTGTLMFLFVVAVVVVGAVLLYVRNRPARTSS